MTVVDHAELASVLRPVAPPRVIEGVYTTCVEYTFLAGVPGGTASGTAVASAAPTVTATEVASAVSSLAFPSRRDIPGDEEADDLMRRLPRRS